MQDKEISVFVDESGSFDPDAASSRYYLLCIDSFKSLILFAR